MIDLKDKTLDEVNLILKGLLELPAKESMNLIIEIQNEAQEQLNKAANKNNAANMKVEKNTK